jgi:hypothetical protein
MTRWKDGKLDLGELGVLWVFGGGVHSCWYWRYGIGRGESIYTRLEKENFKCHDTEAAAKRAAVSWLRRALQQAGKRVEG